MTQKGFQQMLTAASAAAAASETDVRVNSVPAAPSPIPVPGYKPNTQTTCWTHGICICFKRPRLLELKQRASLQPQVAHGLMVHPSIPY